MKATESYWKIWRNGVPMLDRFVRAKTAEAFAAAYRADGAKYEVKQVTPTSVNEDHPKRGGTAWISSWAGLE